VCSFEIDKAREFYRPAAARASVLYFILNDLYKINPIYQVPIFGISVSGEKYSAQFLS
jgi:dynein heavy chain